MIHYDFKNGSLDQFIGQLLGASREAMAERAIRSAIPVIQGRARTAGKYTSNDGGIFYQEQGRQFRTYLYLKKSKVHSYGLPKRHYFICEKVQEKLPYVIANQDEVDVQCSETDQLHSHVQLDVCGYCAGLFKEKTAKELYGKSFHEVVLDLEEANPTTELVSDGYTINWNEISTAYRRIHNYTCEKCGLAIIDPQHQHWMHVHHRNHDKTDNRRSNLQCLCILCHSRVDELHRRNFSVFHQKRLIREFREKYHQTK